MKKSIKRDLSKYIDVGVLRELEKRQYSQKVDKSLQTIFAELIGRLDTLESETSEKDNRINVLNQALAKQKQEIIRRNAEEDRAQGSIRSEMNMSTLTRDEKVWAMYSGGLSQRQIAKEIGVSQPRVCAIILKADNPLFTFNVTPENYRKFRGAVSVEERDLKICEWRDMGYTLKQIAKGVGLSVSRISEIVSEKCTQVQKTETLKKKSEKNNVHRNTQTKIEKIRKVAPWLAEKCEAKEMSVRAAKKFLETKLGKPV